MMRVYCCCIICQQKCCPQISMVLALLGVGHWRLLDGTRQGLLLAALCAVAAPAAELLLMGWAGVWHYPRGDLWGALPSWSVDVCRCIWMCVAQLGAHDCRTSTGFRGVTFSIRRWCATGPGWCGQAVNPSNQAARPPTHSHQQCHSFCADVRK